MNLWQRFTGALTGLFSKSQGTRRFGSLFNWGWSWPGAWGANRAEQAAHYTGWPYVAIRRIAEEIAQHPPCVGFQREGGTSTKALKPWQRLRALSSVPTHDDIEPADPENPLVRLLKNPNPPDTGVTFWYKVGINLEAMGETFLWLILDGDGKPTEMYVLPSHWVWVKWKGRQGEEQDKGESDSLVDFYEIRAWGVAAGSANIVRLRPEEVIHIAYPGLLDPMRGYSSMQAGSLWVDNAKAIDRSQFAKFQNEVTASVALELDGSIAEPDQDQRERLKSLLAGYQGVDHAGEPIILPAGAKLTVVGRSGVEMDYLNSGTDTRDKCLALWHVPKSVIGMTEEVNRASMAASMDYFRSGPIAFKLKLIGSVLTEKLAKRFDPTALIYHEVPPPHDPDAELARWQWGTAAGITEVNEARAWLGLEPKANGDRALVPTGVTPVDWDEAEPNYLEHALGNDSTTTQGDLDPQAIPGDVSGQPQIDQTPERAELLDKAGGLAGVISVIGQVSSGALPATAAARLLRLFYGLSQLDADALVADVQVQQPELPGGPGGSGPGAGGEGKVEEPSQVPAPPKVEMPKTVEKRLRSIGRVLRQLQKTHANGREKNIAASKSSQSGDSGGTGSEPEGDTLTEDNSGQYAEMIAEILYGIYGDEALDKFQAEDKPTEKAFAKAWDALDHPRGPNGRFIPKGSAEAVAAAKEAVGKALRGEGNSEEVAKHLAILSVKQLKELHKEHGQKIPGKLRAELVEAVQSRLPVKGGAQQGEVHGGTEQSAIGGSGSGAGSSGDAGTNEEHGGSVAETPGGSSAAGGNQGGADGSKPDGSETAGPVPRRVAADHKTVNKRLDRMAGFLRSKGQHEQADWMEQMRNHVNKVGVESALASLGEAKGAGLGGEVQYEGGWDDMGHFAESWLNRHGIVSLHQTGGIADANTPVISSLTPADNALSRGQAGDFTPIDPTWGVDKLKEAKHLPGLEASEDIGVIMGKEVTHFTPDVIAKLNERYGEGKWIVKSYGDEAFAGFGIYFPQRVQQIPQDARNTIWASGERLHQYGFSHLRDDSGKIVGIKHSGGDEYRFGTEKYDKTIQGDAREWADKAAAAAPHEQHAEMSVRPGYESSRKYMAQPAFAAVGVSDADRAAGKTIAPGEGRVHITTRNGKAEIVPHATWIKGEHLPVVFESEDTRAMAQSAVDAINALPESERQGQVYAPDVLKAEGGYKVVEANPVAEGGGSGYLGNNPFIIDSYVSHVTGREPAHVQFVRKLLSARDKTK